MPPSLDGVLERAGLGLLAVSDDLRFAERLGARGDARHLNLRLRASAYVWTGAVVERYLGDLIRTLLVEISATGSTRSDLRLSLFSLLCGPEFDSIRVAKRLGGIRRRIELLTSTGDGRVAAFNPAILPLDGRTIRAEHVETVWHVFGFSGPVWPSHRLRLYLEEVADKRNLVAHGSEYDAVAKSRTVADLLKLISSIEELLLYTWETADRYLATAGYRR